MHSGDFSDLLSRAEKLQSSIQQGSDEPQPLSIPLVERNINQVLEAGERLWKRTVATAAESMVIDENVSLLLGNSAVIPQLPDRLEALGTTEVTQERPGEFERKATDVESYLREQEETAILALIDETISTTFEGVQRRHSEKLLSAWDQEKQKLFSAIPTATILGSAPKRVHIASLMDQSIGGRRNAMVDLMSFAQKMCEFTDKTLDGGLKPKMIDMFMQTVEMTKDQAVIGMWKQVKQMIDVSVQPGKDILAQRVSSRFAVSLINHSLQYLEKQYLDHLQSVVYGNLGAAKLGGIPGLRNLVNGYLNVKMPSPYEGYENGLVNGHPVWAVIYCCLRAGDLKAAAEISSELGQPLSDFASAMAELNHSDPHRLSPDTQTKMRLVYQRSVKRSRDPYKRILFSVISGCDVKTDFPEVCTTTDDWLWLRLRQSLHHEYQRESEDVANASRSFNASSSLNESRLSPPDSLPLSALQNIIRDEYGQSHFDVSQNRNVFFTALLLSGQFEGAIEFLVGLSDEFRCHAVHMALVFHQEGLLAVTTDVESKLCTKVQIDRYNLLRLNLVRLVMMFTSKFDSNDPRATINYLYCLRDFKTKRGENFFMASVSDLVLQTKLFDLLLGRVEESGVRKPGLIDKFYTHYDTQRLIEFVAQDSETKGLQEAAVKLYDLAGKHSKALELLSNMLSQVVSQPSTTGSNRERLANLCVAMASRYKNQGHTASQAVATVFFLMMDIMTFFDLYFSERYNDAMEVIRKLKLLPLRVSEVDSFVKDFYVVPEQQRRVLGSLLLSAMGCLQKMAKAIKGRANVSFGGRPMEKQLDSLSDITAMAEAILLYAGRLPYRLPGDVSARLIQMESSLSGSGL